MTKPKIKLTYFNLKGLCEGIRYILVFSEADFEDIRIERNDWPNVKDKHPFDSLPYLEIHGKYINQSVAIARYMGRYHNLVGDEAMQEALLEALVDNVRDVFLVLVKSILNPSSENEKAGKDALKYLLDRLEKEAVEGYFYGSKPTWSDMYFAGFVDTMQDYQSDILKGYPNLTKLVSNITSNELIKKYIENRPVSAK